MEWVKFKVLETFTNNKWRASLVSAAAVIPAPLAYIEIVAVKTLEVYNSPTRVVHI